MKNIYPTKKIKCVITCLNIVCNNFPMNSQTTRIKTIITLLVIFIHIRNRYNTLENLLTRVDIKKKKKPDIL